MKPTRDTIQWIAPHLSEGEVRNIYEKMLEAIGEDESRQWDKEYGYCEKCEFEPADDTDNCICKFRNALRAEQRKAAAKLFNMGNNSGADNNSFTPVNPERPTNNNRGETSAPKETQ